MEQKIKEIISRVLNVDINKITNESTSDDFENWDSLRQMNLIVALEEEFDVEFEDDDIIEMNNVKLINIILKEKLG